MTEEKSFWRTLPGILTGIAAVIGVISGLIFGISQLAGNTDSETVPPAQEFTIEISVNGKGTTSPAPGTHTYEEGVSVDIIAIQDDGWEFDNWTGAVASLNSASTTVTMNSNKTVTANFSEIPVTYYTLAMAINGNGSTSPAVGNQAYTAGTVVSIAATAASGWQFDSWTGAVANLNSATTTVTMTADKTITANFSLASINFPDPNLEAAIREALNKPEGPIYIVDLETLTILEAQERGITDLTGLEYCVNLQELDLYQNNISDISPLAGLTDLELLKLGNNNISDISALAGLTDLELLKLGNNSISDISALAGLTNLQTLRLFENSISDISPLVANSGFSDENIVDLSDNPLSTTSVDVYIPELEGRGVNVEY